MKPPGLTADFRIVRSTPAEDAVWEAVATAVSYGMTPEAFKREAAQAFEHEYHEQAKHAVSVLRGK